MPGFYEISLNYLQFILAYGGRCCSNCFILHTYLAFRNTTGMSVTSQMLPPYRSLVDQGIAYFWGLFTCLIDNGLWVLGSWWAKPCRGGDLNRDLKATCLLRCASPHLDLRCPSTCDLQLVWAGGWVH